jgi:hypothetical protein
LLKTVYVFIGEGVTHARATTYTFMDIDDAAAATTITKKTAFSVGETETKTSVPRTSDDPFSHEVQTLQQDSYFLQVNTILGGKLDQQDACIAHQWQN